ncbi:hypothetical protein ADK67_17220 [Saccharothrix sp. NRRL B-16348]|uniref:copper resistance CopC family protein n=1 Tax=Saccharothrix sp. NRRL B-16348 TaxID=1415542 RepID=UPI0006AFD8F4|nr:copper resistance CopC family protein [Saccharothrix sp. NRRL B-16348]KOX24745.1 hypothetical protein ADK67_17220 [Saccharothrix sp. NRRL B-16348]
MTRLALSALLTTLVLLGASPQASAHTELVSSDPASGASLPQRPTLLTLTFTEPVPAESATVTVMAVDGSAWPLGETSANGASLTVPMLESGSPAGQYTVTWSVESLDGDFVDGTFAFTVTAPPAQQPPAATTPAAPPAVTSTDAAPTTASSPATTTGSVATITTASTGTAASEPRGEGDGGPPLWVWILIVAAVSVIAIVVIVGLSRRGRGGEDAEKPAE